MNPAARRACLSATALAATALFAACGTTTTARGDKSMSRTWEQNRWSELYKLVDANGDGKVTPEEFQAHYVSVTWLYFDKNGDGVITPGEWAIDGTSRERVEWFQTLDTNGDGMVTRKEFQSAMTPEGTAAFFELMDTNGNGFITVEDLEKS